MRRLLIAFLITLCVGWGVGAGVSLFIAKGHIQEGLGLARGLKSRPLGSLAFDRERTLGEMRAVQDRFEKAQRLSSSALLIPARAIPVLGRQLRSVIALSDAAARTTQIGSVALEELHTTVAKAPSSGIERIQVMRRVAEIAEESRQQLEGIELGPSRGLFASLATARLQMRDELTRLKMAAGQAAEIAEGLGYFMEGPNSYLLLAANNAEMRAGSGTFLIAAELLVEDGVLSLSDPRPTWSLALPTDASVSLDEDMAERWGWLEPNREWRNLGVTPRFEATAGLAQAMWRASGEGEVDGVIAVDVLALRALLSVTGKVEVEGRSIDASNVLREIFHDQYVGLQSGAEHERRRDRLGALAREVVASFNQGGWEVSDFVTEMARISGGRHLLAWAARPGGQRLWRSAGVDGRLEEDSVMVAVINRGASKLDQHLDIAASIDSSESPDGRQVSISITITNQVPDEEIPYIVGPFRIIGVEEGTYAGLLAVNVPGEARRIRFEGEPPLAVGGPDGPTLVAGISIEVPRQEQRTYVLRFRLPSNARSVLVEPSARFPAVRWRRREESWSGDKARRVDLSESVPLGSRNRPHSWLTPTTDRARMRGTEGEV